MAHIVSGINVLLRICDNAVGSCRLHSGSDDMDCGDASMEGVGLSRLAAPKTIMWSKTRNENKHQYAVKSWG